MTTPSVDPSLQLLNMCSDLFSPRALRCLSCVNVSTFQQLP